MGLPIWSVKHLQNTPYWRYQWVISDPKGTLTNCRCNCSQLICGYTRDSLPFPYSGAFPNKGRNFKHFFPSANYSKKPQPMFFHWPQRGEWSVAPRDWMDLPATFSLAWARVFLEAQASPATLRPKNHSLSTVFLKDLSCLSKSQPLFSFFSEFPGTSWHKAWLAAS